jgi:hypothetical protein
MGAPSRSEGESYEVLSGATAQLMPRENALPIVRNFVWHLAVEIAEASIILGAFGTELRELFWFDSRGSAEAEDDYRREMLHVDRRAGY